MNKSVGIFSEQESKIVDHFISRFVNEVGICHRLFEVYESFLKATNNKVKDNDFPNWSILMLLSQILPLMNNSLQLLTSGYLRQSECLIRVASEGVILSTYFKDFPETEEEYRKTNYRDFFHKHKIDDMLKRVEKNGHSFVSDKPGAKKVRWHQVVFKNLFEESSRFLHNNPEMIYYLTTDQIGPDHSRLIIGPQLYTDEVLAMGLRRILNTTLFSLVVLGLSLNIMPEDTERDVMDEAQKVVESLNKI